VGFRREPIPAKHRPMKRKYDASFMIRPCHVAVFDKFHPYDRKDTLVGGTFVTGGHPPDRDGSWVCGCRDRSLSM
jgi:hypothetical protein